MKTVNVVLFGIGNVGSTLINQINEVQTSLKQSHQIDLKIPIVTNSGLVFFASDSVKKTWESDFSKCSVPFKIKDIIDYVNEVKFKNLIAVDATASSNFVQNYIPLIESGFHIVTANKVANTLDYNFYKALRNTLAKHKKQFLYETNVGAGLPVIETIKNVYGSGDKIQKLRGVFSGSLSYIFNTFSKEDVPFSEILERASKLGLTEPDAREDLSGNDVARKLLILAREIGLNVELNNVLVDSLVPKALNGKTTQQQFNARRKELDIPYQKIKRKLNKDTVLRYVGELDVQKRALRVKLIEEQKQSAFGQLEGADSIFEIFTKSYGEKPIVIQGAGAGKEVTARGLLADIIKLSNYLN